MTAKSKSETVIDSFFEAKKNLLDMFGFKEDPQRWREPRIEDSREYYWAYDDANREIYYDTVPVEDISYCTKHDELFGTSVALISNDGNYTLVHVRQNYDDDDQDFGRLVILDSDKEYVELEIETEPKVCEFCGK